jgi:NAD(P)-dependent dehydrogenase (short-subunit alcohol dehydrogenase family)
MKDFNGKTAFITGAASGIGLGMSITFARAGMNIIMSDIRKDDLDKAAEEVKKYSKGVYVIAVDVSDRAALKEAADEAEKAFGKIHILCNNAGINIFGPIDQATYDDWDWMINVNLYGVINGLMSFLPKIKAHGEGGHIVNTASMAAFVSSHATGVYSATKHAVRGLTETLWYNLAPQNIGVSMLCPGFVNSNIHKTEELRPEQFKNSGYPADPEKSEGMGKLMQAVGMSPLEVGERVLRGIRNNDLFIFSHPEMKEEVEENFKWILSYFPEEEINQKRKDFENMRRSANIRDRIKYDTRNKVKHAL